MERLDLLDAEWGRLGDLIWDLEDARLATPTRSRHDVLVKIKIIAGRYGLAFDVREHLDRLAAQIGEWRRAEPVIWPTAGRVNA